MDIGLGGFDAAERVARYDWGGLAAELEGRGSAVLGELLTPAECVALAGLYPDEAHFRSHVRMARHGFGQGEYRYFRYPLPELVSGLRTALYPRLAPVANAWSERLRLGTRYPATHAEFLADCHAAGQTRPTPLLLQYGPGDYNCLHQDLYGELAFPLQVAVLLVAAGAGLHRGRVRADRAAPADADPGGGGAARPRRRGGLRRGRTPGRRVARRLPGEHAAWGEPAAVGPAAYGGADLSRREVTPPALAARRGAV